MMTKTSRTAQVLKRSGTQENESRCIFLFSFLTHNRENRRASLLADFEAQAHQTSSPLQAHMSFVYQGLGVIVNKSGLGSV
jgi:hypothetical protein